MLRTVLRTIVDVELPLPLSFGLTLLGVGVELVIVTIPVGEETVLEFGTIAVALEFSLGVKLVTLDVILEVRKVVGEGNPADREFVVMIVVSWADGVSGKATVFGVVGEARVSIVVPTTISTSTIVGAATGLAVFSAGGDNSTGGVGLPGAGRGGGLGGPIPSRPCRPRSCFVMLDGVVTRNKVATSEGARGSVRRS